ncbi:MAG: DctP family TRAP transporter solute-binding subunit [Rhodocyclaceae bacterium]
MQNPQGHPLAVGAEKFAELVSMRSGGRLRVALFPGGVLGSDSASVAALQNGSLDIVVLNSGILAAQVKDFEVFDFPFLFASFAEADAVVDGPIGQKLHARLAEKGLVGLAFWELGFRQLTNNRRPVRAVRDIAGLKLRVIPNAINLEWVQALKAYPIPMAFPELAGALKNGAVDGQENPVNVILANKFYETQKYLTLTNHQYNPQSLVFSRQVWDTLDRADMKILQDAAVEAGRYQRKLSRDVAASALHALRQTGIEISELSAAELAQLRARLKPVVDRHGAAIAETSTAVRVQLDELRAPLKR